MATGIVPVSEWFDNAINFDLRDRELVEATQGKVIVDLQEIHHILHVPSGYTEQPRSSGLVPFRDT